MGLVDKLKPMTKKESLRTLVPIVGVISLLTLVRITIWPEYKRRKYQRNEAFSDIIYEMELQRGQDVVQKDWTNKS